MVDTNIVIKLQGVSKKYKLFEDKKARMMEALHPLKKQYHTDFYALNNINLEIRKGEILGIVGMNGSGKSTLLKIISGIIQPSDGTINVNGHVVPLLELGSGFNPEFTGLDNIYFYNSIHGYSHKQTDVILDDILDFAEIGSFIRQPLKTYSSGMKARLAFAVSVNIDPDILILDEVLSVGDELFRRKCYARMEEFFKAGKTVLFVSHSVQSINQLCTRTVFLNSGELILEGPTKMVTAQYERYLYAKKEKMQSVKKEIILLNDNKLLKEATYNESEKLKTNFKSQINSKNVIKTEEIIHENENNRQLYIYGKEITIQSNIDESVKKQTVEFVKSKAYFIPDLIPKSTVEYRDFDVDISDIYITTPNGEKVNILITGEKYIYKYKVSFNIDAEDVSFGMTIKSEKGLIINGIDSYGMGQNIERVQKNDSFILNWEFYCNLLFGDYFTNAGVISHKNGENVFLNRIIDAMFFKVKPNKDIPISGFVNLNQKIEVIKIF
jgi:lipopolysaccharide transport system ATP-binding protein